MAAGENNGFDGRKFGKYVAMLDSPEEGDADVALHVIREMLRKSGRKFYEAVETRDYKTQIWTAFDEPECLRDYFEGRQGGGDFAKERSLRAEAEREAWRLSKEVSRVQAELDRERELRTAAETDGQRIAEGLAAAEETIAGLQAELAAAEAGEETPGGQRLGWLQGWKVVVTMMVALLWAVAWLSSR